MRTRLDAYYSCSCSIQATGHLKYSHPLPKLIDCHGNDKNHKNDRWSAAAACWSSSWTGAICDTAHQWRARMSGRWSVLLDYSSAMSALGRTCTCIWINGMRMLFLSLSLHKFIFYFAICHKMHKTPMMRMRAAEDKIYNRVFCY